MNNYRIAFEELCGRSGHSVGRILLERLYREETGEEMPPIALEAEGKPYFPGSSLHFSISHTKRHAFCVLSHRRVGIDAEETDRDINLRLVGKILSPGETERYREAPDKRIALLKLWVLKEAYVKCTGTGLRGYPNRTDFSPEDPRVQELGGCFVAVVEE